MKKVSRILLLVGMIIGLVAAGILLLNGIAFIILSIPPVVEQVFDGYKGSDVETAKIAWTASFLTTGIVLLVIAVFELVTSLLAIKANKVQVKKMYIVSLVFGALFNELVLAGSIVGIIAHRHDNDQKVVDAEVK